MEELKEEPKKEKQPETPAQTLRIEVVSNQTDANTGKEGIDPFRQDEDPKTPYQLNPVYHRFSEYLGIDKYKREDLDLAQKISYLYDWGKEKAKTDNATEIIDTIRSYMGELGVQFRGKELVSYLYQMMRLNVDSERIRAVEKGQQIIDESIKQKVKLDKVEPKIDKAQIDQKVKESIKEVRRDVKRRIKSEMAKTIKQGIQEAIRKAGKYG